MLTTRRQTPHGNKNAAARTGVGGVSFPNGRYFRISDVKSCERR